MQFQNRGYFMLEGLDMPKLHLQLVCLRVLLSLVLSLFGRRLRVLLSPLALLTLSIESISVSVLLHDVAVVERADNM